jgi:hypothetical protein
MPSAIEPAVVLAAYTEPVASGRRVLFVGPASSALPERLIERGARLVHACDPEPVRLAEATAKNRDSSISYSSLGDGHFALRDGAFDLCIIEDAGISDPVPLLRRVRRALSARGVVVMVSGNPEVTTPLMPHRQGGVISLDYYALYDAVKAEFEHVRMLGQAPFVGYVVADFAPEGAPEPSLDTAFLPGGAEEPELFIAIGSQQPVELDAFAVVQLPYRSVLQADAALDRGEALRDAREAEQEAKVKLVALEAALANERQTVAGQAAKLREAETRVFARDTELGALRQELEHKNQLLKTQEGSLKALNERLSQGPSPEEAAAAASDLSALELALRERGDQIRRLERDLREAERTGKELVRKLAAPEVSSPEGENAASLAQQLAKSHADLIATRWALEAAVRRASGPDAPES